MFDLNTALRRVIETDGSDLHLKVPSRPLIRRLGHLEPIPETDALTPEDTERVLRDLLKDDAKMAEFEEESEVVDDSLQVAILTGAGDCFCAKPIIPLKQSSK